MRLSMSLPIALAIFSASFAAADEPVSFRKDLAPILLDKCLACHGPKKAEGGFRVDSYERVTKEGDSGSPGFTASDLEASEVFRRIASEDEGERMPLEADPLPAEQIALFKRFVEEGAKFDGEDPTAELITIVPAPKHPEPPESYRYTMPVTAVLFNQAGTELIAGGYHELTVWNPVDGKLIRRIKNVGQRTRAMSLSPDGKLLAVGCGAPGRLGETRVFDMSNGEIVHVLGSTADEVLDVAFSPDGTRLAMGAADGVLRIFEIPSGKLQLTITSHSDWVMAVAWNADNSKLASGSRDKTAKVFDAKTGELLVTYSGHGQPVKGIAFHPENKDVFSGGADNKIHRWQIADAKKTAEVGFGGEVFKLPLSGEFMFASSADKTVRKFESKTQKQIHSFAGHQDWALSVAYHDGTKRVASGGFDGRVRIWNAEDAKEVVAFVAAPGYETAGQ
jgi:dipeptidyl aminopeptidase/acylaminoacyl peptidase